MGSSVQSLVCVPHSDLLHTQEAISKYRPGGYHPVCLGDIFDSGRYKVFHKLGWGGFSTVWLARDCRLLRWVALKIATAASTPVSQELWNWQQLEESSAAEHAPQLFSSFFHNGPNGRHQCLVSEFLGPPIATVVNKHHAVGNRMGPETILRITRQVLQAVACVHRAGYAHGDISVFNFLFAATQLEYLSEEALFKIIGPPETSSLSRKDGKPLSPCLPRHLVKQVCWDNWVDEGEEGIRLVDWGEAFPRGTEPDNLTQPCDLKAPETIFADRVNYRVDLWSIGCMIYSLVFVGRPFIHSGDEAAFVKQMIGLVEELPLEWELKWQEIQGQYSSRGDSTCSETEPKLLNRFRELVPDEELKPLLPIIQGLLRFRPPDRISAVEALALL